MLRIRKYEWEILRSNLVRSGVSSLDATHIIDKHKSIMDKWYEDLRLKVSDKKLTQDQANKEFKAKFWKMCQKWENWGTQI